MVPGTDWVSRSGPPYPPYGILFAQTAESNPYRPCVASLVGFLRESGATEEQVRMIGSDNPRELLGGRLQRHLG